MGTSRYGFDFVGRAKLWYTISIIITGLGVIGMIYRTVTTGFPLRLGIDFTGGSIIQLQFDGWDPQKNPVDFANQVQGLVAGVTESAPSVQTSVITDRESGQTHLLLDIRADASLIEKKDAQAQVYAQIKQLGGEFKVNAENQVGALIGQELTQKAVWGVIIGNALILLYITFRLAFDFGICAIVGLLHDILVVMGTFAIFNIEINSPFVAILLTVVGYSVQDTIIIYDRVRENMRVKRHLPFDTLVNVSLNETLTRSINTTVTIVLAIIALLIFGGASIRTFMVGLAVGISTGAYSSIFICAPLIANWRVRGKGSTIIEEKPKAGAIAVIAARDEEAEKPVAMEEAENGEPVEMIQVGDSSTKTGATKRLKRRRRR